MADGGAVPYNNRFRVSSSDHDGGPRDRQLSSLSAGVDVSITSPPFLYSPRLSVHDQNLFFDTAHGQFEKVSCYEQQGGATHIDLSSSRHSRRAHAAPDQQTGVRRQNDVRMVSVPAAPGKPRRLSRQISTGSGIVSVVGRHVTSSDAVCDDVFVEVGVERGRSWEHPASPSPALAKSRSVIFSTSSTASILPNPYNRINHRIHSAIWCCSCVYFAFFCCLPAIHYMEQCDLEYNNDNHKRARCLGRTASFLFFTGTLITISVFGLVFFLAIFFAIY